ncbi:uncharacterized protein LOC129228227 [Uloborus diversus]|uniref:uncharacterized protein LOC129228227 n=1 Tax=Uloborus diversus TaxID=327109 RepID=UPI0024090E73|nr:uncharacterized protein LOC129228227 [Uloborus diversus]
MNSFDEVNSLADFILSENQNEYSEENREELTKILNFLIHHGCSVNDIKKYSKHLNILNCSYNKIKLLEEVHSNILTLLPLLSLPTTSLYLAVKRAREEKVKTNDFPDRISYLCHHLELSSSDLISALTKHPALLTMKFKRLEQKMNILKDAEISTEYIVKDLWIFNYNEKLLANRIQAAQKAGVEPKPWMLRCSEKFFESMLVKNSETQRILDGEDEISYLARKLNCSKEYVDYMMERNKLLKTINIPKLEQVINFLFEKGYTPQEVRLFPRVFCSSVKTLEKKFEKFKQIRKTLPTISQLCISSKKL